ncbi:hypothetical protein LINPERHAP1_LOCUS386 [Linum perenne]
MLGRCWTGAGPSSGAISYFYSFERGFHLGQYLCYGWQGSL